MSCLSKIAEYIEYICVICLMYLAILFIKLFLDQPPLPKERGFLDR